MDQIKYRVHEIAREIRKDRELATELWPTGRFLPRQLATAELLAKIETNIAKEEPEVQWAMNFTDGWIGIYEKLYRDCCIAVGQNTGLYKGEMVSKGSTPDYLPDFIAIESNKRNL